ncbi:MAG: ATP synthase F1 subunit gamma [Candidatus Brocadiia bacterium]
MANTRTIKRKIRSVNNIKKITRAMEMVSAAKMKKAQGKLLTLRPYTARLTHALGRLLAASAGKIPSEYAHLISHDEPKTISLSELSATPNLKTIIVITSGKGLCGSYNANIIRTAVNFTSQQNNPEIITIGRKIYDYFHHRGVPIKSSCLNLPIDITLAFAQDLIKPVLKELRPDAIRHREIWVVYSEFVNAMISKVRVKQFLPIQVNSLMESDKQSIDCLFEPESQQIIRLLLPRYINVIFYQMLLEAVTSEHSARMLAMRNATENASEVIDSLTLSFNKARQAGITKELLDIVGGAEAMR